MNLQRDVGRKCGKCTACCKPFAIAEVDKHDAGWCRHCALGKGCKIYADRPLACRLYACAWLNGIGDSNYRPDRLGVMMDIQDAHIGERLVGVLHLWEIRKGAIEQDVVRRIAEGNKNQGFIVVYHRILSETSYEADVSMRKRLFTEEEATIVAGLHFKGYSPQGQN